MKVNAHPISIIEGISKNFWILLFPLLRGLIATQFDLYRWVTGAWLDLIIVTSVLVYAILRWRGMSFILDDDTILVQRGIIFRSKSRIPLGAVTTVIKEQTIVYSAFGAVKVRIETNAGSKRRADFKITVRKENANTLNFLEKDSSNRTKKSYAPKWYYLIVFSLISSNSLSGVIFLSAFISQTGAVIGRELRGDVITTITTLSHRLAIGIPPIAIAISIVILSGWVMAFIFNVLRHLHFEITRSNKNLHIKEGLFTKRQYHINADRIAFLDMRQTLTTKIFSIASLYVYCAGYGKEKNERAVLVPATSKREVEGTMKMLVPEIAPVKSTVKPSPRGIVGYVLPPALMLIAVPVAAKILIGIFASWHQLISFVAVMSAIPLVWLLVVNLTAYITSGIGENENVVTIRYVRRYSFSTITMPKTRIAKMKISQTPFQRWGRRCNVVIYTNAESKQKHIVRQLPLRQTRELMLNCNGNPK